MMKQLVEALDPFTRQWTKGWIFRTLTDPAAGGAEVYDVMMHNGNRGVFNKSQVRVLNSRQIWSQRVAGPYQLFTLVEQALDHLPSFKADVKDLTVYFANGRPLQRLDFEEQVLKDRSKTYNLILG